MPYLLVSKLLDMSSTDTKQKILSLGEDLLHQKGYNAFSYHDISTRLGIKNAAVHYHFPSKSDLGVNLVRQERLRFERTTKRVEVKNASVWEQLQAFIRIYERKMLQRNRVCIIGMLGTDFYTIPEPMQKEVRLLASYIVSWLGGVLERGRERGELYFKGNAEDKALLISSSLAASLQLSRILGNEHFYQIKAQLEKELKPNI